MATWRRTTTAGSGWPAPARTPRRTSGSSTRRRSRRSSTHVATSSAAGCPSWPTSRRRRSTHRAPSATTRRRWSTTAPSGSRRCAGMRLCHGEGTARWRSVAWSANQTFTSRSGRRSVLDERKSAILRAIVQEYITTAQPVGSTLIAKAPGVQVSSATVRNEMAVLEQEGYLVQPHTSAGRVPTDKGYRFFVDTLAAPGLLDDLSTQRVATFFETAHGRLEEMLHQTSNLLAHVTQHAAMVVGPGAERAVVRSVQ